MLDVPAKMIDAKIAAMSVVMWTFATVTDGHALFPTNCKNETSGCGQNTTVDQKDSDFLHRAAHPPSGKKDCYISINWGRNYRGETSVTLSGRKCQRWIDQTPNTHSYKKGSSEWKSYNLKENHCRNPSKAPGGPWCYTTDKNTRWEYCLRACEGFVTLGKKAELEFKASSEYNNEYGAKKAVKDGYWSSKRNAKPLPLYWWMSFKNEPVAIVSIAFGEHWKYMGAEFEFIASDKEECDENGKVLIKGTQAEIYGAVFTNEQSYYCYGLKITKLGRYGYASVKNFYYRPVQTWRNDWRCGKKYLNAHGQPATCNGQSNTPCCSPKGWCGKSDAHCTCAECADFSIADNECSEERNYALCHQGYRIGCSYSDYCWRTKWKGYKAWTWLENREYSKTGKGDKYVRCKVHKDCLDYAEEIPDEPPCYHVAPNKYRKYANGEDGAGRCFHGRPYGCASVRGWDQWRCAFRQNSLHYTIRKQCSKNKPEDCLKDAHFWQVLHQMNSRNPWVLPEWP